MKSIIFLSFIVLASSVKSDDLYFSSGSLSVGGSLNQINYFFLFEQSSKDEFNAVPKISILWIASVFGDLKVDFEESILKLGDTFFEDFDFQRRGVYMLVSRELIKVDEGDVFDFWASYSPLFDNLKPINFDIHSVSRNKLYEFMVDRLSFLGTH